jgi:ornithine cyclodeaminase/alanine dehydrogenase-like protein (mu-crystallin family)
MIPGLLIGEDLLDLVIRRIVRRRDESERIAFIFRGLAIGNLALTILAYEHSQETGFEIYLYR